MTKADSTALHAPQEGTGDNAAMASALRFLAAARTVPELAADLAARRVSLTAADIVTLGEAHGFSFDADSLRQAFRHDWAMRWLHRRAHRRTPG